jgi:hypothetical protein
MNIQKLALMSALPMLPLVVSACATTGSAGGGKSSSAPFQGQDAVTKRRNEISDAGKAGMECMKTKEAQGIKGGVFAVMADAGGKLNVTSVKWNGPDGVKQCIVDAGNKATITPLPGPSVGTLWEFIAPGENNEPGKAPGDLAVKMQPLQEPLQNEVVQCGQRTLGVDFGATIDVSYYLYNDGKAYAPTVVS